MEVHNSRFKPWGLEEKQFLSLMHLSQFASYIVPLFGIIIPLFMWLSFKDQNQNIDTHGKMIMNWIVSSYIYGVICFILTFVLIGIPLMFILGAAVIIFPIIGAVRASNNEFWNYPATIKLIA